MTIIVASSNTSGKERKYASYICDGVADDIEINTALRQFSGKVLLTRGTFNLTSPIKIPAKAWLQGEGFSTVLKPVSQIDAVITLENPNVDMVFLTDFSIDGNKSTRTGILFDNKGGTFSTGMDAHNHFSKLFIRNCTGDGLTLVGDLESASGARETHLNGLEIYRCDGNGFVIKVPDVKIIDCVAGNNGLQGFAIGPNAGNSMLTGCKAFGSGQMNPQAGQGFSTISTGLVFVNCQSQDNKDAGFQIKWNDVLFIGCHADSNGQVDKRSPGFLVSSSGLKRVMFIGCYARDRFVDDKRVQSYGFQVDAAKELPDYVIAKDCFAFNNYYGSINNDGGEHCDFNDVQGLW